MCIHPSILVIPISYFSRYSKICIYYRFTYNVSERLTSYFKSEKKNCLKNLWIYHKKISLNPEQVIIQLQINVFRNDANMASLFSPSSYLNPMGKSNFYFSILWKFFPEMIHGSFPLWKSWQSEAFHSVWPFKKI